MVDPSRSRGAIAWLIVPGLAVLAFSLVVPLGFSVRPSAAP